MLRVVNLVKKYDTKGSEPAGGVFDVSFEAKAGEMFTLLGPSGCGKTTTLRSIAGLERPDAGAISLFGQTLFDSAGARSVPMYDRDIGMVFQSYAIWPHMSVFENAAYPLRVMRRKKPSRAEIDKRVTRVLAMVGLVDYRDRSATLLSGGQQQRLALARALVREPKLLLLDEPLSNLDAQLREQMRGELKRIQAEWGVTTIYVTHDQAEAMAISDRIAVMNRGRVAQLGRPEEIYDTPNSEFVAHFIGKTNLFRGRLEQAVKPGQSAVVQSDIGRVVCQFAGANPAGAVVSFVVRPENVGISRSTESQLAKQNTFEGQIASRVYLGDVAEYAINIAGKCKLLARGRPTEALGAGDRVVVSLPVERTIAMETTDRPHEPLTRN